MKKHILRAPGTDRYALNAVERLADITDYGTSYAAGRGANSSTQTIETANTANIPINTFSDLANVTSTTALVASVSGLFLCVGTFLQVWNVVAAPNYKRRVGVSLNGAASFNRSLLLDNDAAGGTEFDDQCSFLIRLAAGDTLQPRFQNYMAGSVMVMATLEITKIAP